jgi:hypothetical protein
MAGWHPRKTRDLLDRQCATLNRYQAAREFIRVGDLMRILQRAGRPVTPEMVMQLEALGRRLDTAPRRRILRRMETVHLPNFDIPRQYIRSEGIKFPEWIR